MKILLIGLLSFVGWSTFSSYYYICKIRGLCNEPAAVQITSPNKEIVTKGSTLPDSIVREKAAMPGNMVIYFAFDESEFDANSETDKYLDESSTYLYQNDQALLSITGYTDAVGSDDYNQALGYRRAQRMQHYFESRGMPEKKILIESKGEKDPAGDNNTEAGRANNRRATITIKN